MPDIENDRERSHEVVKASLMTRASLHRLAHPALPTTPTTTTTATRTRKTTSPANCRQPLAPEHPDLLAHRTPWLTSWAKMEKLLQKNDNNDSPTTSACFAEVQDIFPQIATKPRQQKSRRGQHRQKRRILRQGIRKV